jgi:hypothetical protein
MSEASQQDRQDGTQTTGKARRGWTQAKADAALADVRRRSECLSGPRPIPREKKGAS